LSVEKKEAPIEKGAPVPLYSMGVEKRGPDLLPALGLQVASVILEAHSGKLIYLSSPQDGTQYLVQFPSEPKVQKPSYLFKEKRRHQRIWVDFEAKLESSTGSKFPCRVRFSV